jgi:hypothetical protein
LVSPLLHDEWPIRAIDTLFMLSLVSLVNQVFHAGFPYP